MRVPAAALNPVFTKELQDVKMMQQRAFVIIIIITDRAADPSMKVEKVKLTSKTKTSLKSRWFRIGSLDAEEKICKKQAEFQSSKVAQIKVSELLQLSVPERPAAVLLQVVLGSFAVVGGQVKLCRGEITV